MKRKNLLLLFFFTLLAGIAIRRAPWFSKTEIRVPILRLDTAALSHISIEQSDTGTWGYQKVDHFWTLEQEGRTVRLPEAAIDSLLQQLLLFPSKRLLAADSGFETTKSILKTTFWYGNQQKASLEWHTYPKDEAAVRILPHRQVYVTDADLLHLLLRNMAYYRKQQAFSVSLSALQGLRVHCRDSLIVSWEKTDTTGLSQLQKQTAMATQDSMLQWWAALQQIQTGDFADFFDEQGNDYQVRATINCYIQGEALPLTLRFIDFTGDNLPEDISNVRHLKRIPPFILHASQNKDNYFSVFDTAALFQLMPYAR